MVETRDKVISYRRAVWLQKPAYGQSLEISISDVHDELAKVNKRIVERYLQKIKSAKPKNLKDGGILFHFISYNSW